MSKSLKRVEAALDDAGHRCEIIELEQSTKTAQTAADAIGCDLDQIAKSIIFLGETSGKAILFITAGSHHVDPDKASQLAGESLGKADAKQIRKQTGFAIGGVAPVGHISPIQCYIDPKLGEFTSIFAAAGTPNHIFKTTAHEIQSISHAQIADFIE